MNREEHSLTEIDNYLYTCSKSDFNDFESMSRYLDSIDIGLEMKISQLQKERQSLLNQYETSSKVYEINAKRRNKQQSDLKEQYSKLCKQLGEYERTLRIQVLPMTPELIAKSDDLEKMEETKELLDDLNNLMLGKYNEVLQLDDRHFQKTATKITVLKTVLEEVSLEEYGQTKKLIERKYEDLRQRIFSRFQAGYLKKNVKQIKEILPLCSRFGVLPEISNIYVGKVFRQVNILKSLDNSNEQAIQAQIKNLFFLLQRGFEQALLAQDLTSSEPNENQVFKLFGDFSQNVVKTIVNYAFESVIKVSLDNVLSISFTNESYLNNLEIFFDEAVMLVHHISQICSKEEIVHLLETYLNSLFDDYLEQYTYKQLGYLEDKYEKCTRQIMSGLDFSLELGDRKQKFEWKKLFQDFRIDQTDKMTGDDMEKRIKTILSVFMDVNLEHIFEVTNKSLQRNNKIARFLDRQKNQVKILDLFSREMGQFLINLIRYTATVIPNFNRRTPLGEQFFEILPQLNALVQRMQLIFQTYPLSKSTLNQGIKLEQNREDRMHKCEVELQKLVHMALASLQISQNMILKESIDYKVQQNTQSASPHITKLISFVGKYLRRIRKNYSAAAQKRVTERLGIELCDLLIQHFCTINYTSKGLYQMLIDIGNIKKLIYEFNSPEVENKYEGFKALIDLYLLKNDTEYLKNHVNQEKEKTLKGVSDDFINRYISNKKRNEAG